MIALAPLKILLCVLFFTHTFGLIPANHFKGDRNYFIKLKAIASEAYSTAEASSSYAASYENPPFFPTTLEELADDAAFATKVALVSRVNRIRIDIRLRLTERDRYMFKWLMLTAENLIDGMHSKVHVFVDKSHDLEKCRTVWTEIIQDRATRNASINIAEELAKIAISSISDIYLRSDDSLLMIFNPDNIYSCEHPDLLEDVQALCFHAALRSIPVVLVNPLLMSTAWNDYGMRQPMLLSDFAQAYFICDDYFMLTRRDQWCGIIQRAASGFDLFLLEGLSSGCKAPSKYTRLHSWPDGVPHDIKSHLARALRSDPEFPLNVAARQQYEKEMRATEQAAARSSGSKVERGRGGDYVAGASCGGGIVISRSVIDEFMRTGLGGRRSERTDTHISQYNGGGRTSTSTGSSSSSSSGRSRKSASDEKPAVVLGQQWKLTKPRRTPSPRLKKSSLVDVSSQKENGEEVEAVNNPAVTIIDG